MFIGLRLGVPGIIFPFTPFVPPAGLATPAITQTNTAGTSPFTWDTTNMYAGLFLQVQVDNASDFATPTQDHVQMITPSDVAAGTMTITGFTTPVGSTFYVRVRFWDGATGYSSWSNTLTDFVTPVVPATANRILQLEASDSANLFQLITAATAASADNDPVGTWRDKNGNGFDLAAPANDTTRPLLQTVNGKRVVRFDRVSSQYLFRAASLGLYSGGACTIMFAVRMDTTPAVKQCFCAEGLSSASNPTYQILRLNADNNDVGAFIKDNAGNAVVNGALLYDEGVQNATDVVIIITDTGSALTVYIDGVAGTPTNYTRGASTGWNRFALGALLRTTAEDFLDGDVYGALFYNAVLGSSDIVALDAYGKYLQGR